MTSLVHHIDDILMFSTYITSFMDEFYDDIAADLFASCTAIGMLHNAAVVHYAAEGNYNKQMHEIDNAPQTLFLITIFMFRLGYPGVTITSFMDEFYDDIAADLFASCTAIGMLHNAAVVHYADDIPLASSKRQSILRVKTYAKSI
ncbi:hypothetical protein ACJX0J_014126 [Zea mays]